MRDEFLINRHGKQYVLFAGLLDEAHSRGLRSIETELIQVPEESNRNVAIARAVVKMNTPEVPEDTESHSTFTGIGDASPENVGRAIVPHLIRMAETRAKARALRDAINVGVTALEELSDSDETPSAPSQAPVELAGATRGGIRDVATKAADDAVQSRTEPVELAGSERAAKIHNLLDTLGYSVESFVARHGKLTELESGVADDYIGRLESEVRQTKRGD